MVIKFDVAVDEVTQLREDVKDLKDLLILESY